jgi:hypothetical protein
LFHCMGCECVRDDGRLGRVHLRAHWAP